MDTELRTDYELGYHVTTNVAEGREVGVKDELEKMISAGGGTITFSQAPERKHLSYPIKHQSHAYFGWMQFSLADREQIASFEEHLRLNGDILRYVILKLDPEKDKRTAPLAQAKERKAAKEAAAKPRATTEKKAEDTGNQDKELEDVLGNL